MQRFILSKKNQLTIITAILIISAFLFKFIGSNNTLFEILLLISSIFGILPIAIQAYQALRVKVVSIDLLVTIAVIGAIIIKNYEESAIVTFLFLFGAYLEKRTLIKTRSAIKGLIDMSPSTGFKQFEDNEFIEVDIDEIEIDDILLVKTGSSVPVDGYVINGEGYINEASITGESVPLKKTINSKVFAGTILDNGTLQIKAEKVGEDTTFGKIIELVEEAQDSKSAAEKFIDKFAKYYTPLILLIALVVYIITKDVELSITILVLGCPGALVIGVPVSNVAGIGNGAKNGIILKGSEVISDFSKVDTILFDKTGTLTIGKPVVTKEFKYGNKSIIKDYVYKIESESSHPLANAIKEHIKEFNDVSIIDTNNVKGQGIKSNTKDGVVLIGNEKLFISNNINIDLTIQKDIDELKKTGHSIVLIGLDNKIELLYGIKDETRPDVLNEIKEFKKMGIKQLIVLSGDNQHTVDLIVKELNLTNGFGNMLPDDKQKFITKLQKENHIVAFVGDGINDSPSIATANVGIAMGSGTDVAIETSDVVLISSNFESLRHALKLSKSIRYNMIQNIMIAIGVVAILLASLLWSDWMNMSVGMIVHEGSILVVIINAMRLLRFKNKKERLQ